MTCTPNPKRRPSASAKSSAWSDKYSKDTVVAAMQETQDYVERIVRRRLDSLPQGEWETTDYIDLDPGKGEGLVPIKIKLTLDGKGIHYDLSGSAPAVKPS